MVTPEYRSLPKLATCQSRDSSALYEIVQSSRLRGEQALMFPISFSCFPSLSSFLFVFWLSLTHSRHGVLLCPKVFFFPSGSARKTEFCLQRKDYLFRFSHLLRFSYLLVSVLLIALESVKYGVFSIRSRLSSGSSFVSKEEKNSCHMWLAKSVCTTNRRLLVPPGIDLQISTREVFPVWAVVGFRSH